MLDAQDHIPMLLILGSFKNLLSILDEMGMSEEDSAPYPTRTTVGVTGLCGDA